ncbi:MAG: dTDP-4-amino-4,6-dideoxyglucose formyltransferase [Verrucomicrobiae bacterium]|nr:dTDP-4-amino-4,6-dideoxyglucose formyltransferase [Verrucomicrobiae bacterium]
MRILVLTDNQFLHESFRKIVKEWELADADFDYRFSPSNKEIRPSPDFFPLNVKTDSNQIVDTYNLVISLHCKQLFPPELVNRVRCVNVHPGYNPHNRGWYPQVFSIINKLPLGATIHEIDVELDHGPIIDQLEVPVYSWDTSLSAYERVLEAELHLLRKQLKEIVQGTYDSHQLQEEGNINFKKDFSNLCHLNLKEKTTVGGLIDRLRATSHGDFRNSYFLDENGHRVYVRVILEKEDSDATNDLLTARKVKPCRT